MRGLARLLYAAAAVATFVMATLYPRIVGSLAGSVLAQDASTRAFGSLVVGAGTIFLITTAALLALAATRPARWNRLLGVLALPWIGFSLVNAWLGQLNGGVDGSLAAGPAVAGALLALAALCDVLARRGTAKPAP